MDQSTTEGLQEKPEVPKRRCWLFCRFAVWEDVTPEQNMRVDSRVAGYHYVQSRRCVDCNKVQIRIAAARL